MIGIRIFIFIILAVTVYCGTYYSISYNLPNNGTDPCPTTWKTFRRPNGYLCVKIFYEETNYITAKKMCEMYDATLLNEKELRDDEIWGLVEATDKLRKEMGDGSGNIWTAVDKVWEAICVHDAETNLISYDCAPTRVLYICEKLLKFE